MVGIYPGLGEAVCYPDTQSFAGEYAFVYVQETQLCILVKQTHIHRLQIVVVQVSDNTEDKKKCTDCEFALTKPYFSQAVTQRLRLIFQHRTYKYQSPVFLSNRPSATVDKWLLCNCLKRKAQTKRK